jgi:hypothetical protein
MYRQRSLSHRDPTARALVSWTSFAAATVAAACVALAPAARAQECPPPGASCPAGGTAIAVDFEALVPGTPVEGLGTVHPDLAIATQTGLAPACTPGTSRAIQELDNLFPSYGSDPGTNACLNGFRGFGDDVMCTLNYEFTFSAGTTVSCFSLLMLDFGDLFPYGVANHNVVMNAYAGAALVDTDVLAMVGPVQLVTGDACDAQDGNPGRYRFRVAAPGITRVTLTFDESPDPNVGFDDLQFCKDGMPVGVSAAAWSRVKSLYRMP